MHTASKQRGLVVVSYYDLRAAVAALGTLQGTLVCNRPLEIHFSNVKPSSQDVGINQVRAWGRPAGRHQRYLFTSPVSTAGSIGGVPACSSS